jgi:hypothetical protein
MINIIMIENNRQNIIIIIKIKAMINITEKKKAKTNKMSIQIENSIEIIMREVIEKIMNIKII